MWLPGTKRVPPSPSRDVVREVEELDVERGVAAVDRRVAVEVLDTGRTGRVEVDGVVVVDGIVADQRADRTGDLGQLVDPAQRAVGRVALRQGRARLRLEGAGVVGRPSEQRRQLLDHRRVDLVGHDRVEPQVAVGHEPGHVEGAEQYRFRHRSLPSARHS